MARPRLLMLHEGLDDSFHSSSIYQRSGSQSSSRRDSVDKQEMEELESSATEETFLQERETAAKIVSSPPRQSTNETPCYKHISVEPIILLYAFSLSLTAPVLTTLFLTHTCRSMGFNQSDCSQLEGSDSLKNLETLVQPPAGLTALYAILIETALPAVMILFVGPWSDLYGRKTFLVAPFAGIFLKYLICLCLSFYPTLPAEYILLASVPVALTGGAISLLSMCYCYVSDVTDDRTRGFRIGMVEASYYAGVLFGNSTVDIVFKTGEYNAIFTMAAVLSLMAIFHCICWVTELSSVKPTTNICSSVFQTSLVKDMFDACFKQRHRNVIMLAAVVTSLSILTLQGELAVLFFFTRNKFSWDFQLFTTYASVSLVLVIVGTVFAVATLSSWLGIPDGIISCVAFVLKAVSSVLLAISPASWWLYLASVVGMFGAVPSPLVRAIITKVVNPQDIGKVLSLMSCVEAVTPLCSGPLYTLVYNHSLVSFPGAFFLVSAAAFVTAAILVGLIILIVRRSARNSTASSPK